MLIYPLWRLMQGRFSAAPPLPPHNVLSYGGVDLTYQTQYLVYDHSEGYWENQLGVMWVNQDDHPWAAG